MYADDACSLHGTKQEVADKFIDVMSNISEWLTASSLLLNITKTICIFPKRRDVQVNGEKQMLIILSIFELF